MALSVEGQNNIEISKQLENGHILDTGMEVAVGLTHFISRYRIAFCTLFSRYNVTEYPFRLSRFFIL